MSMFDQGRLDAEMELAAIHGQVGDVKELLRAGAHVHAGDDLALRLAAAKGLTEIVKVLLEAGAKPGYGLFFAVWGGHSDTLRVLLEAGADARDRDDELLAVAERRGYTETVELLNVWIAREKGTAVARVSCPACSGSPGP